MTHGDLVRSDVVLELAATGALWDTAQGWYVNRQVAFRPLTAARFQVIDLAAAG